MSSGRTGTIYIDSTDDLARRVYEHKTKLRPSVQRRHRVDTSARANLGCKPLKAYSERAATQSWTMPRLKRPTVAFAYDFDGTLSPGNMQEHSFLPALGIDPEPFWANVAADAEAAEGDNILMYMQLMLEHAKAAREPVTRSRFREHGSRIGLFPGVDTWFDRVNTKASARGLAAEHYIISSGVREMIEGTSIAKKFKKIFASTFWYDANDTAIWPAMAVNYTTKTQFLFRINKNTLDVWDHSRINQFTRREDRHVPFDRMVFIGDGETDIPCMRLVTEQGGYSIAVYPSNRKGGKAKVQPLIEEQRARFVAAADYSEGTSLDVIVETILDDVKARVSMQRLQGLRK